MSTIEGFVYNITELRVQQACIAFTTVALRYGAVETILCIVGTNVN